MLRRTSTIVLGLAALLFSGAAAQTAPRPFVHARPKVPLRFDHFYNYGELVQALRKLVRGHPRLLRLRSLGKSYEGRDIWLVTVNNPATGPDTAKAAMYIDGNIHGNEVQAAEVCLYTIWYLAENYGKIERVTRLVNERAFYVVPTVNPDGRAWWFDAGNTASSSRSGKRPYDNDRDGLVDEDGYDDLDGDGHITQMRKKVRLGEGTHRIDPQNPDRLIRVRPPEKGDYLLLGLEGIDNDGDGRVNEDGPGGYDMNRNWPSAWRPRHIQHGAGDYPFSFPETRCVGAFLLAHPNIAGVQAYHNSGGMILRGPGARQISYPREDVRVYDTLGRTGEKILPFYRYLVVWKDLYTVYGGFINWTYEGLGIFSFTNELWTSSHLFEKRRPSSEERRFFEEKVEMGRHLVKWKPYHHPTYGAIEIGGRKKTSGRVPPLWKLPEECHRNCMFTLYHAGQMPRVAIDRVKVRALEDGVFRVEVVVKNDHVIPTISAQARTHRIGLPDRLTVSGPAARVVAAGTDAARRGVKGDLRLRLLDVKRPGDLRLGSGVRGRGTLKRVFLVVGRGRLTVRYVSQKGGKAERTVVLGGRGL